MIARSMFDLERDREKLLLIKLGIMRAKQAVDSWIADNHAKCPPDLQAQDVFLRLADFSSSVGTLLMTCDQMELEWRQQAAGAKHGACS